MGRCGFVCRMREEGIGKEGMQTVYYIGLVCISAMVAEQHFLHLFTLSSSERVPFLVVKEACGLTWRFHDSGAALWLHGGRNTLVCMHAGEDATGLVVRRARERLLDCWTQP